MQLLHPGSRGRGRRKNNAVVVVKVSLGRDSNLPQIVRILDDARAFLHAAEHRERDRREDRDDRDHDQQFDQSKRG